MTKLRQFLRNSARAAFSSLILIYLCICLSACTSSTAPTYEKEDVDKAVRDICKKEYDIDVKTRLVGKTLWIYLPAKGILEKSDKPSKYMERFRIDYNQYEIEGNSLIFDYTIEPITEQEKINEIKYSEDTVEKINDIWKVLRRVLFSMGSQNKNTPHFFCLVIADIEKGYEIVQTFYYLDLKKVSYGYISWTEYHHRSIQDTNLDPHIIDDSEGAHLEYSDISMAEFISRQIQHRINLKFQKPEVDKGANIDKEVMKIVVYTLKTYDFKDFSSVELNNLLDKRKVFLNQAAILAKPIE